MHPARIDPYTTQLNIPLTLLTTAGFIGLAPVDMARRILLGASRRVGKLVANVPLALGNWRNRLEVMMLLSEVIKVRAQPPSQNTCHAI